MTCGTSLRILILEDEGLIALDLATFLERHGHKVVGPAATCLNALKLLQSQDVDVGILDLILKDETCEIVADQLDAKEIPWLLLTGIDFPSLPKRLKNVPSFARPIVKDQILAEIQR